MKRKTTTIDDVRANMLAALPDSATLIVEQRWRSRRDDDEFTSSIGYSAHVVSPRMTESVHGNSPADLYRKFLAQILPRLNPPARRASPGTGLIRGRGPVVVDTRGEVVSDEHDLVGCSPRHTIETTAVRRIG